jgi:hypothetical protein
MNEPLQVFGRKNIPGTLCSLSSTRHPRELAGRGRGQIGTRGAPRSGGGAAFAMPAWLPVPICRSRVVWCRTAASHRSFPAPRTCLYTCLADSTPNLQPRCCQPRHFFDLMRRYSCLPVAVTAARCQSAAALSPPRCCPPLLLHPSLLHRAKQRQTKRGGWVFFARPKAKRDGWVFLARPLRATQPPIVSRMYAPQSSPGPAQTRGGGGAGG